MCELKRIFFRPQEAPIQIHPAKQNYVNFHEFCLHIWKPIGFFPLPDLSLYALDQLGKRSTIRLKSGATVTVITDNSFRSSEWKHISVSLQNRFPTWNEMCEVKDKFFKPEEAVIQIHSAERDCVESDGFCLHLWMPIGAFPLPNPCLVY